MSIERYLGHHLISSFRELASRKGVGVRPLHFLKCFHEQKQTADWFSSEFGMTPWDNLRFRVLAAKVHSKPRVALELAMLQPDERRQRTVSLMFYYMSTAARSAMLTADGLHIKRNVPYTFAIRAQEAWQKIPKEIRTWLSSEGFKLNVTPTSTDVLTDRSKHVFSTDYDNRWHINHIAGFYYYPTKTAVASAFTVNTRYDPAFLLDYSPPAIPMQNE